MKSTHSAALACIKVSLRFKLSRVIATTELTNDLHFGSPIRNDRIVNRSFGDSSLIPNSSMSARLSRLHHAMRCSSMPFLYPCLATSPPPTRLAMMSAIRSGKDHSPQPSLADAPPTAILPSPSLFPDAASPQIAARPPPAPKIEKPRPRIRSSKAALSIVRRASLFSLIGLFT